MELKSIMENAGFPYQPVLNRFAGNEALLKRFLLKFPQDPSFGQLEEQVFSGNFGEAERSAHTLKGVSANLGFEQLSAAAAAIVSAVRAGETERIEGLFADVRAEYEKVLDCLRRID